MAKSKKDKTQPGMSPEWQCERQEFFRRIWRRQIDALGSPDDDRYKFVRGMMSANDLGTARSSVYHTVHPGMARHLDQARAGVRFETPPPLPTNVSIQRCLHRYGYEPYRLALARLALATAMPDHSLVFELTGWQTWSEYDLSHAFDDSPRSGWSRPNVHIMKNDACAWVRKWLADREAEQTQQAS